MPSPVQKLARSFYSHLSYTLLSSKLNSYVLLEVTILFSLFIVFFYFCLFYFRSRSVSPVLGFRQIGACRVCFRTSLSFDVIRYSIKHANIRTINDNAKQAILWQPENEIRFLSAYVIIRNPYYSHHFAKQSSFRPSQEG